MLVLDMLVFESVSVFSNTREPYWVLSDMRYRDNQACISEI